MKTYTPYGVFIPLPQLKIKGFLIFIALLGTFASHGQTMRNIKQLLGNKSFQPFKIYIDSCQARWGKGNVSARWEILRDILPGYQEGIVEIQENKPANDGTRVNQVFTYRVNLLTNGQEMFYYTFSINKPVKINNDNWEDYYQTLDSFSAAGSYTAFENVFRQTYHTALVKADLFQIIVYGGGCGIAGEPTEYGIMLNRYITNNDTDSILSWLKSANTEKQLYALSGITVLIKGGYSPTAEDKKLITLIRQKDGIVNTCAGCIYSSDTIKNIIAEIDAYGNDDPIITRKKPGGKRIFYIGLAALAVLFGALLLILKRSKKIAP